MTQPEPLVEHRWLLRLVGEWTYEGEATMAPDQPPEKFAGSESTRAIGDLWILSEGRLPAPPGTAAARTVLTLDTEGPDPVREGKLAKFQDLIEMNGDDHRILRSRYQAENGEWRDFMRCDYRRTR